MSTNALVILAPGFEEIEAVTPIDVLRRVGVHVTAAGLPERRVRGSRRILLEADLPLDEVVGESFDALILPGGMPGAKHLSESDLVRERVLRQRAENGLLAAECAAPGVVLAPFGALEGVEKATGYPGFEESFPASCAYTGDAVTLSGNVLTGIGPGAALAFSLELVSLLLDRDTAEELARTMQVA
jgi:protein deglycase